MAATTFRWRNTSGDHLWATVANWDQGALPGTGGAGLDTVIFDGVSQADCYGDDRSADNLLLRIVTMPAYTGDIGSSGNPLIHHTDGNSVANGRVIHRGSGTFYFSGKVATVNQIIVDTPLQRGATMILDGRIHDVCVKSGWVSILSTCSVSNSIIINGTAAYVVQEAVAAAETPPWRIIVSPGRLDNYRATSTLVTNNILATGPGGLIQQFGAIDEDTHVLLLGGRIVPQPPSLPIVWPEAYINGYLDVSQTVYALGYEALVFGQQANIGGNPAQVISTGRASNIDLRDEYP